MQGCDSMWQAKDYQDFKILVLAQYTHIIASYIQHMQLIPFLLTYSYVYNFTCSASYSTIIAGREVQFT